jgi:DNA replication protein DnaC
VEWLEDRRLYPPVGVNVEAMAERLRWLDCNIPKPLLGLGIESLDPLKDPRLGPRHVADWVLDLPRTQAKNASGFPKNRQEFGRGLILVGSPGTGKTTALCAALTTVRHFYFKTVYFTTFADYLRARQTEASVRVTDEARDAASKVLHLTTTADVVGLDDVGHEYSSGSGFGESILGELTRRRYNEGLPTIITTNLGADEWQAKYGDASTSFIRQACFPVIFDGPDLRLETIHAE